MSTASQAMRLFRNCLSVRDTANGLLPVRFTDAQLAVYAKSELFGLRSFLPAGIAIDIMTDTRHIEIDFAVEARIREWINFDMHVDGIFMATLSPDLVPPPAPMAPSEGRLRWDLPEGFTGIHRLTLYLPHCVKLTVRRLGFSEAAEVRPAPEGRGKLLCLGDSITQGMDALHPSSTYPVLIARAMKFDLLNQGVGGFFFDADSLDPSMHYNPDIVTVAYGTNDWNTCSSPRDFMRKASTYIGKVTDVFPKARIFILSPIWRKDLRETKAAGTFHSIGQTISHICSSHPSIRFVDGMRLVPHQERFFGDGPVHPNDEGFVHFALNLAASLQESC